MMKVIRTGKKYLALCLAGLLLAGCSGRQQSTASTGTATQSEDAPSVAQVLTADGHATINAVALSAGKYSDEKLDASWSNDSPTIVLSDSGSTVSGSGATVSGSTVTITKAGTYLLSGAISDGQIIVEVSGSEAVKLVLDGVSISCASSAPLYIKDGDTILTLAPGSQNTVIDARPSESQDDPDAAIFAKDDLTVNGSGSLTVQAAAQHGVKCKDALKVVGGTVDITAAGNGAVGKDSVSIKDGSLTITAGGDGIKATNTEDATRGYVMIDGGDICIRADGDGIQAETLLRVNGGTLDLTTGSGSANAPQNQNVPDAELPWGGGGGGPGGQRPLAAGSQVTAQAVAATDDDSISNSTKGLKCYVDLVLAGGTGTIDAYDDGVHSDSSITVTGGSYTIATGDDGMHADRTLTVEGGAIDITRSYEGLEAFDILLSGGDIQILASDDGINAAGDAGQDEQSDSAQNPETGLGRGGFEQSQGASLTISGGTLYVNASGDGLDANGSITMTGGTVTVQGPTSGGDGALDFDDSFDLSGGTLLALGSSGMAQQPDQSSSQPFIAGTASISAGAQLTLTDAAGNALLSVTAEKSYQWYCLSAPGLQAGQGYTLTAGGSGKTVSP